MLKVTFPSYAAVDENDLAALLRIVKAPLTVEPLGDAPEPKTRKPRTPKAAAPEAPAPETPAPVAEEKKPEEKKPEVKAPAKKAAAKSTVTGVTPGSKAKTSAPKGEAPDAAALLDRFSKLIDTSYDDALGLLEQFGVARFSDLKETEFGGFAEKLDALGV